MYPNLGLYTPSAVHGPREPPTSDLYILPAPPQIYTMSSLQDIMNVDEDPELNKRHDDPTPSDSRRRPHQASTAASSTHARYSSEGIHVTRLEDTTTKEGTSLPAQTISPSLAGPGHDSSQTTAASNLDHDCTSGDVMDPPYGHTRSGSSGHYGNTPMRPFVNSPTNDTTRRLTPVTGRVSRAKKGVPVHTCDQCRPPKVCLPLYEGPFEHVA